MSNDKKTKVDRPVRNERSAMQISVISTAVNRPRTEDVKKPKGDKK